MAGRGPAPKPAHLRQRTNRKAGATSLEFPERPVKRDMPNPDQRVWHPLTVKAWANACASPMATQWLETDWDGLGRLALLWDEFYKAPDAEAAKEIRLQSPLFGLSPLDRSRLQWEVSRGEEAERRRQRPAPAAKRTGTDPRTALMVVK